MQYPLSRVGTLKAACWMMPVSAVMRSRWSRRNSGRLLERGGSCRRGRLRAAPERVAPSSRYRADARPCERPRVLVGADSHTRRACRGCGSAATRRMGPEERDPRSNSTELTSPWTGSVRPGENSMARPRAAFRGAAQPWCDRLPFLPWPYPSAEVHRLAKLAIRPAALPRRPPIGSFIRCARGLCKLRFARV